MQPIEAGGVLAAVELIDQLPHLHDHFSIRGLVGVCVSSVNLVWSHAYCFLLLCRMYDVLWTIPVDNSTWKPDNTR